jgi:hypothetical protein
MHPTPPNAQPNPITAWFTRLSTKGKVIAASASLITICVCCSAGVGIVQGMMGGGSNGVTNPSGALSTYTSSNNVVVDQPTDTPAPPTATPDPDHYYYAIVKNADNMAGHTIHSTYDAGSKTLTITDNIGDQLNTQSAVLEFRLAAYSIFQALYTNHGARPGDVKITFNGPTQNAYGNSNPDGYYASAEPTTATAAQFTWGNLTPDQAWAVYDSTDEAPFFN